MEIKDFFKDNFLDVEISKWSSSESTTTFIFSPFRMDNEKQSGLQIKNNTTRRLDFSLHVKDDNLFFKDEISEKVFKLTINSNELIFHGATEDIRFLRAKFDTSSVF